MAVPGCVLHRTLARSRPDPDKVSSAPPSICREPLYVVDLQRYTRDQGSSVYFHQSVLHGDDLYDATLTDGDCRIQVTLDPGLNRLVERDVLRPGSTLCNATFAHAMAAQLLTCSYKLVRVEVRDRAPAEEEGDAGRGPVRVDWDSLPWFRNSQPAGPLVPLRAHRNVFLPLWNNVDYIGEVWRETPPTEEEDDDEEQEEGEEGRCPGVTVSDLRDAFLSGRRGVTKGVVQHQLIVRIINKSALMYYGKPDKNCGCPYKALLEVCDRTGCVCVVLWNSVCLSWYRFLKPGDIFSLRRYRVKQHYLAEQDDIEISVNSKNPAAQINILPESSVMPDYLPPAPTYSFQNSVELQGRPNGSVCDVIGLVTFLGRPERIRTIDGRGMELLEYRWLRLQDGSSDQPVMVKLFPTSQPETHGRLHPLSVVVCTRMKLITAANQTDTDFYLTNTTYTQVYCTGLGHHSEMRYRKLRPVQQFLKWLRCQDDGQMLSRALIGGFFVYPPPPISLEIYMKDRKGEPGFLQGAELQKEVERLCYRERRTFCIQATVTMVMYSCRGGEDRCLFWADRASSLSQSSSSSPYLSKSSPCASPSLSTSSAQSPILSTPRCLRRFLSSSSSSSLSPISPSSSGGQLTPRLTGKTFKRKLLLQDQTPKKRHPRVTLQREQNNSTAILFDASNEFLKSTNADEEDDDDDTSSFVAASQLSGFSPVALESLPIRYDHARREEQAAAVAMEGRVTPGRFDSALKDYYTLRLRALSDRVLVDVVFLPHSSASALHPHSNTWTSILSHGAFSSHAPPPSPADLIGMAGQLTNQRLVCVLEACHLGGARSELVLSRAFYLSG